MAAHWPTLKPVTTDSVRQCSPPQLLRQRAGSQGPLLGRHYPASTLLWPCPTPGAGRHPFRWRWYTMLHRHWVSLSNAICLPGMPCSLPRWTEPVLLSVTSRLVLPSPFPRRVGVHDFAFEVCSNFTRVTACRVARPPYSGLCREASTRPVARAGPLVSYHVYRQLHGWVLPPLANCAGKAHLKMRVHMWTAMCRSPLVECDKRIGVAGDRSFQHHCVGRIRCHRNRVLMGTATAQSAETTVKRWKQGGKAMCRSNVIFKDGQETEREWLASFGRLLFRWLCVARRLYIYRYHDHAIFDLGRKVRPIQRIG